MSSENKQESNLPYHNVTPKHTSILAVDKFFRERQELDESKTSRLAGSSAAPVQSVTMKTITFPIPRNVQEFTLKFK